MKHSLDRWTMMLAALLALCMIIPTALAEDITVVEGTEGVPVDDGIVLETVDPEMLEMPDMLLDGAADGELVEDGAFPPDDGGRLENSLLQNIAATYDGGYEIENGVLIKYNGTGGDVVIPSDVTRIGAHAFAGCDSLTGVTIPKGVTSIGEGAFRDCTNLARVTIPNSVTRIKWYAFYNCASLERVIIPNRLKDLEDSTFRGCTSLKRVTIPKSMKRLGYAAFYGCAGLTDATIPDSVTSVGNWVFGACTSLTGLTIPKSVKSIGEYAFYGCTRLTRITIPASVKTIKRYAFDLCNALTNVWVLAKKVKIDDNTFFGYTPTLHIIKGSNAVAWAKSHGLNYDLITLSKTTHKLKQGKSATLKVLNFKGKVTWSSSKPGVASVKNGKVKAKKAGKCVISAKLKNGPTLKCTVTVARSAKLSTRAKKISAGDSFTLKLTGGGSAVKWTSSNPEVAKITRSDKTSATIKGLMPGKTVISAKIDGVTLKCAVTVVALIEA